MARTLICEIVTPERILFTNEVEFVVVPTLAGEIGILPMHAPIVSVLDAGEIRVRHDGSSWEWFAVSGGYVQVHEDKVIVLADDAVATSQIDIARAKRAAELAAERLAGMRESGLGDAAVDLDDCMKDLKWSELQATLAERRQG